MDLGIATPLDERKGLGPMLGLVGMHPIGDFFFHSLVPALHSTVRLGVSWFPSHKSGSRPQFFNFINNTSAKLGTQKERIS